MKKMKKIFKITSILILFASIISCSDYLDVNDSIDNPNLDQLNPNELIVGAQALSAETYTNRLNRVGNWMGVAWSGNYLAFNDAYGAESRYLFSNTFYNDVWDDLYRYTSNFATIEKYNDDKNWNNQKAAAKILKAFYVQYIVDLYGNAPYTEAFEGTSNQLFPKYDNAQDIYKDLIKSINEAVQLINNGANSETFGTSDITFNGDMTQWKAFANTVKLRMLVRLILKAEQDSELLTFVNAEFSKLNGAQFVNQDVTINPGYSNTDDRQNPFWEVYGFSPAGIADDRGRRTGPSEFAFNLLDNSDDPRLNRLWKTNIDNNTTFAGTQQNGTGNSASIGDGILVSPSANLPIMLTAESYFLQAEAVQRGYLTNGNAQTLFNQGIISSFASLGAGDPSGYMMTTDTDIDLGFNGGDPLRAILTQKWIALTSVSGAELWIEYNRTGFPSNLPLPNGSTDSNFPVRLLYPASEYSGNSDNVIEQTRSDAFTSKIFWDVN